ncbi:hypothetical protein BDR05DRAFT_970654 [Suillus weaverae]|nr:hypothetical protein BDR05DRAFT_970654 [Suillus weaverae]
MHCELYPSNAPIQPQIATELKHELLRAHSDFLTSDTSVTSPRYKVSWTFQTI